MFEETKSSGPTLTVLIQTFQGDIIEQCRTLRDTINQETPEVKILAVELALGRFNIVAKIGDEKLESLLIAWRRIQSLSFVQNSASFTTYSTEIVPSEIGGFEVTQEAKAEILQYLGKMRKNILQDVGDIEDKLETLLLLAQKEVKQGSSQITPTEIRLVEKELDRRETEKKFRRQMRTVTAILGGTLLFLNIVLVAVLLTSASVDLTPQLLVYMLGLAIIGGVLMLIAVAYERVSAFIGAKFGKS